MKITSEKFLRFYIVASFMMIVFLLVTVIILLRGQSALKKEVAESSQSTYSELSSQGKYFEQKFDSFWSDFKEMDEKVDLINNKVDRL